MGSEMCIRDRYRSWKEHYLDVLFDIRHELLPAANENSNLPYWLRNKAPEQVVSVDNSLKVLTFTLTTILALILAVEVYVLLSGALGFIFGALVLIVYAVFLYIIEKSISRRNSLSA